MSEAGPDIERRGCHRDDMPGIVAGGRSDYLIGGERHEKYPVDKGHQKVEG